MLLAVADNPLVVIDLLAALFGVGLHLFDSSRLFLDFSVSASKIAVLEFDQLLSFVSLDDD